MAIGSTESAVVELVLTVGDREFRQKLGEDGGLLKKFGKDAGDAGGGVVSLTGKLTALRGAIAATGAAYAAARIGAYVFETAKEFESLNAQLITTEKTQARAQLAFDRIQDFASKTPFALQEVVQAFINLRNFGLEPSAEALTAYGNIAGSMSKSLDQVIQAVADAATGEFERLKEFGIRARQQGDEVTFTFQGVSTTVRKNATEIEHYLQRIGLVSFAGGMERQAATIEGVTSNMGDAFARLATKVDGRTGFTAVIKAAMTLVTSWVNQLSGVPGSIDEITAAIERLEKARGKTRDAGDRKDIDSEIAGLQDKRLQALLQSTDTKLLDQGIDLLRTRLEEQRKLVTDAVAERKRLEDRGLGWTAEMLGTGSVSPRPHLPTEQKKQSDLEFQLALAQGRRKRLQAAADQDAAEADKVRAAQRAEEERQRAEEEKKLKDALLKGEQRAAAAEAERNRDAIRQQMARNEEMQTELQTGEQITDAQRRLLELKYAAADVSKTSLDAELRVGDALERQQKAAEATQKAREKTVGEAERVAAGVMNRQTDTTGFTDVLAERQRLARLNRRVEVDDLIGTARSREMGRFNTQQKSLQAGIDALEGRNDGESVERRRQIQEAIEAGEREHQDRLTEIERTGADARDAVMRERLQTASDFFGDLATIAEAFGEKGFKAYKALAIAQTLISTYQGAQNAFTSLSQLGPYGVAAGIVAAAAAVAQGLARVQSIRAMEPGRQFGGPMSRGGMHPFMEGGEPELLKTRNGKYYLGVPDGGVVQSARAEPSGRGEMQWTFAVNNSGVEPFELRVRRVVGNVITADAIPAIEARAVARSQAAVLQQAGQYSSDLNRRLRAGRRGDI